MADTNDKPRDVLGAYIRTQRRLADLSLRQLAEMTSISNAYLSQVERGLHQPSLRILRSIAEALKIPGEDLMTHAGLRHAEASAGEPTDTEAAILADPHLPPTDREMLLQLYRALRSHHAGDAPVGETRSGPLQQDGDALADSDAHRDEGPAGAPLP
jgi:transcriptional regulator with XRE-family HTH domain